jgi:hypothetical protein
MHQCPSCGEDCTCFDDDSPEQTHTNDWIVEHCAHVCDGLDERAPIELDFEDKWPGDDD